MYECEKCNSTFESKSSLEMHVYRYHEEENLSRFCNLNASLTEVLEHKGQNGDVHCVNETETDGEDMRKTTANEAEANTSEESHDEESEMSDSLFRFKCNVRDFEAVTGCDLEEHLHDSREMEHGIEYQDDVDAMLTNSGGIELISVQDMILLGTEDVEPAEDPAMILPYAMDAKLHSIGDDVRVHQVHGGT